MMETVRSSKTVVCYCNTTQYHDPENTDLNGNESSSSLKGKNFLTSSVTKRNTLHHEVSMLFVINIDSFNIPRQWLLQSYHNLSTSGTEYVYTLIHILC